MAYLLSNICTKNYQNQTTTVEVIVGDWVVSFFETQYVVTAMQDVSVTIETRMKSQKFLTKYDRILNNKHAQDNQIQ